MKGRRLSGLGYGDYNPERLPPHDPQMTQITQIDMPSAAICDVQYERQDPQMTQITQIKRPAAKRSLPHG
ncbi:hypothetical protein ADN01_13910 [Levilinea saccharolytica]|uniref:Uncharacterized protein n=1 Tax=Levilinea saccharolytica TaxID=229921 RepID=A0A0P6XAJ6_9CHLR|nr:hypothetical protein ADN01_13910 [Levilinea saccharolytica]